VRQAGLILLLGALLAANAWLLTPGRWDDAGFDISPDALVLQPGERRAIAVVNREAGMVALRFRVRYDPRIVEIDSVTPVDASVFEGGPVIALPAALAPGTIEAPGIATAGGRPFIGGEPVYRLVVRALAPGTTALVIDDAYGVDLDHVERSIGAAMGTVTVRAP
jgi:hypothetical protein